MEEVAKLPELTNDFIESMVGKPVDSFEIRSATVPGENYMSVLYCIEVKTKGSSQPVHVICKCYPLNPHRQLFLNKANTFWNELQVYRTWIPALQKFATNNGEGASREIKLPFAPLINGKAVDFGTGKENDEFLAKLNGKIYGSFDNYLAMVDMKQTHGFRLANRFTGLGLDEVELIMGEHAKLHATAWAYKQANGIKHLRDEFKFLTFEVREEDKEMWNGMMTANCKTAGDALEKLVGVESPLYKGTMAFATEKLTGIMSATFDMDGSCEQDLRKLLRVPLEAEEGTYQPWRTVVHGDCWVNNLLFRYDEATGKATEGLLIDLQLMREACPTLDLVYLIYTSTTQEFRAAHLESMLCLYYKKFMGYCSMYKVAPYEGFSYEALKRRFQASKLIGYMMALMALPIMLKSADDVPDLEKMALKDSSDMGEVFTEIVKIGHMGDNSLFHARLLGVAEDLHKDGVI